MIALAPAPAPEESTALLVRAAQAGDREAYHALHARYRGMVHAITLAHLPAAEAEEVAQDAFLTAWQRLPELRAPEGFGAWLGRIARHRCIDRGRRRRELTGLPLERAQAPRPSAEARQVMEHIRALPEAYRETLLMRLVEGMTGPEIAVATGLTAGSVRVNLHRGMKLLRERMGSTP
ncbi:MAG: sigma-70 family RNA polymerase sigma factor [Alphaproteobacteria bacterium]|nr:sigma-70 family RNA polymerase sigma factor [Alphaproteobacteria bacterium]